MIKRTYFWTGYYRDENKTTVWGQCTSKSWFPKPDKAIQKHYEEYGNKIHIEHFYRV